MTYIWTLSHRSAEVFQESHCCCVRPTLFSNSLVPCKFHWFSHAPINPFLSYTSTHTLHFSLNFGHQPHAASWHQTLSAWGFQCGWATSGIGFFWLPLQTGHGGQNTNKQTLLLIIGGKIGPVRLPPAERMRRKIGDGFTQHLVASDSSLDTANRQGYRWRGTSTCSTESSGLLYTLVWLR